MNKILELILKDKDVSDVVKIFPRRQDFSVAGLSGTAKVAVIAAALSKKPRPTFIITERENISSWRSDLQELLPNFAVEEFPEVDLFKVRAGIVGLERKAHRLALLTRLINGESIIVLASPISIVTKDFSRQNFLNT